jgi:hypothetical protein
VAPPDGGMGKFQLIMCDRDSKIRGVLGKSGSNAVANVGETAITTRFNPTLLLIQMMNSAQVALDIYIAP